ncbi:MAG: hypothetical protein AB1807_03280 [Pseudomonadota bacterium]
MAELEIAKHGKNVIQLMGKKEHPLAERLKEMALEIIVIVFAVTLSIWLHGLSEHRHEQQQVKTFLAGLRHDLQNDIEEVRGVSSQQHRYDANFAYLAALDPAAAPEQPRFDEAFELANNNSSFEARTTRFEGFKSSGKLIHIENEALLNNILQLYQDRYSAILRSRGYWGGQQEKLRAYLDDKLDGADSPEQQYRVLTEARGKRLLRRMATSPQLYQRFEAYAAQAEAIVKAIDAAYPELATQR